MRPTPLILQTNGRASLLCSRVKVLATFVITIFFAFWVSFSMYSGTTSGPDSLKSRLNCCGGVHVVSEVVCAIICLVHAMI
jgi:hypothetical protein